MGLKNRMDSVSLHFMNEPIVLRAVLASFNLA